MPRDLRKIFDVGNIVSILDEEEIAKIGRNATEGYEGDEESRSEWKIRNKEGMKLAMQIFEQKNSPFEKAANIKYPLISIASIQFASRAYPNLITGWDIIKSKVVGADPDGQKASKASRVQTHMNYQLNEEMVEWEEETDRLLTVLPISGCAFKETYWSKNQKRNVSVFHPPNDIVMHYKSKGMDTVPRITKRYNLYPNEVVERMRAGMFVDFELGRAEKTKEEDEQYSGDDQFKPHLFLQQHTWLDLDGDGYAEPYIINIHYDTKKVVRIVPRFKLSDIIFNDKQKIQRIEPRNHYTKFTFLTSPDGSIYDWGFGSLLGPINHTVNTTINQLLDAGTWNNSQCGFIGRNITLGRGRGGGPITISPNEWLPVNYTGQDLRQNIVPLAEFMKEPSGVLYNLLGFMVSAGEKLSSVTELMMGDQTIQNEPATTSLARIEQGLKVFSSIHKRLHKALGKEFKLIFALNEEYLDPQAYYRILDEPKTEQSINRADYDKSSCDIIPTSNPEDISNTQKLIKAQFLFGLRGQGFNDQEINRRMLEAMQVPNMDAILEGEPPPPDPKIVLESEKLDLERSKFEFDMMKYGIEMAKIQSEIIKNLAQAEATELGPQLEQYKAQMQSMVDMATAKMKPPAKGGNGAETGQEPAQQEEQPMIPGMAEGGPVKAGKPYLVGEKGPEVIVPQDDGTVIPNKLIREPFSSENDYFMQNPNVGGMADFQSNKIVMNPHSNLSAKEKEAVMRNEHSRLIMRQYNLVPDFDLTSEQERSLGGYGGGDKRAIKETIVGRIISGDPSAKNYTTEQRKFADLVQETMSGYDIKGYTDKYGEPDRSKGQHLSDEYKLPHHITFSDDSKYHSEKTPGGKWREIDGKWHYRPSEFVLSQHPKEELIEYFKNYEPDAVLDLP